MFLAFGLLVNLVKILDTDHVHIVEGTYYIRRKTSDLKIYINSAKSIPNGGHF